MSGLLGGEFFHGDLAVVDLFAAFQQMQLGDLQGLVAQVDAGDLRAQAGHAFRQDAAAAADIQHGLAGQAGEAVDVVQAQRVDVVQRLEFAVRVPPAVGQLGEFFQFDRVGVGHGCRYV